MKSILSLLILAAYAIVLYIIREWFPDEFYYIFIGLAAVAASVIVIAIHAKRAEPLIIEGNHE